MIDPNEPVPPVMRTLAPATDSLIVAAPVAASGLALDAHPQLFPSFESYRWLPARLRQPALVLRLTEPHHLHLSGICRYRLRAPTDTLKRADRGTSKTLRHDTRSSTPERRQHRGSR